MRRQNKLIFEDGVNFVDLLSSCLCLLFAVATIGLYLCFGKTIEMKLDADRIAKSYLYRMESAGYLTASDKADMIAAFNEAGFTVNSTRNSTTSLVEYGNPVTLNIKVSFQHPITQIFTKAETTTNRPASKVIITCNIVYDEDSDTWVLEYSDEFERFMDSIGYGHVYKYFDIDSENTYPPGFDDTVATRSLEYVVKKAPYPTPYTDYEIYACGDGNRILISDKVFEDEDASITYFSDIAYNISLTTTSKY